MDEGILVAAVPVGSFPMDSESARNAMDMGLRCGLCSGLRGPLCWKRGGCVLTDGGEKRAREERT